MIMRFGPKIYGKPETKTCIIWVAKVWMMKQLKIILFKILHPKMIHCCEAPRYMLPNYFVKKQVLRCTFGDIWRIQIQMYLLTSFKPKYGAFNLKNGVRAHELGLVVQLSWRVAPPFLDSTLPDPFLPRKVVSRTEPNSPKLF